MAYSRTASACSLVTPGNHARKSETVAPPSRFSKRATTGTRVPLKTHEPLTLSGSRSTAGHEDQSNMSAPYSRRSDEGKRNGFLLPLLLTGWPCLLLSLRLARPARLTVFDEL